MQEKIMPESIEAVLQVSEQDRILRTNRNHLEAIPEKKKKIRIPVRKLEIHLQIGQLLLHNIAENELENDLYNVLDQCNKGKSLINDLPCKAFTWKYLLEYPPKAPCKSR